MIPSEFAIVHSEFIVLGRQEAEQTLTVGYLVLLSVCRIFWLHAVLQIWYKIVFMFIHFLLFPNMSFSYRRIKCLKMLMYKSFPN